jgi:glycosyltransferase involved in cell wall biosynthesis
MLNSVLLKKTASDTQRRLHVAVVCRELGARSSVQAVALRQARELAHYARVTLLSDSFPADTDPCLFRQPVTPTDFSFLRRFSHVPRELSFALAVKRSLYQLQERGAELDFLHCHGHSLVAIAAPSFKKRFDVPCSLVAHGDVFSSPPGTYDWRLTKFFKWAIPRGYAQADLVIALSPFMRECAVACGADPRKIEIIPNGIEIEEIGITLTRFPNVSTAANKNILKLLFVGGLNERKGVDVLLRAAKRLKEDGILFSLRIVGTGPLRRELERLITLYGLSNEVALYEDILRKELGKLYQWADVTCVPSLSDPLPTVVLESLLAGTPVVGSGIGGIPFMVQSEVNGLLVPPKDPEALSSALARMAHQPGLLRRLREASTPSVFPRFSWARNGEDLIRAIEKTTNSGKR